MFAHRAALWFAAASLLGLAGCSDPPVTGVSLVIDGKQQDVRGSVSCSSHSAGDAIDVGDIRVMIEPQASGVGYAKLGDSTGKYLKAGNNAKLSRLHGGEYDYDITGDAVPEDPRDSSPPKPFELKVKCPSSPE
ncbi:lipoprotein LpqH [Mycobacterium sp.]|uniref:lipoprotein LpqH n=1 Tax=Mycobacterium sp. TaxID=1785 RepID=UPI003BB0AC9D